jgi:hypothetical protein
MLSHPSREAKATHGSFLPALEVEESTHIPPAAGETLLQIYVINAEGVLILQTVWATTPIRASPNRH